MSPNESIFEKISKVEKTLQGADHSTAKGNAVGKESR